MLHAETGISRADFEGLDRAGIAALQAAVELRNRRAMRRDAGGYALLCNLLSGNRDKVWTAEDFLPKGSGEELEGEELEAARAAYEAMKARGG